MPIPSVTPLISPKCPRKENCQLENGRKIYNPGALLAICFVQIYHENLLVIYFYIYTVTCALR